MEMRENIEPKTHILVCSKSDKRWENSRLNTNSALKIHIRKFCFFVVEISWELFPEIRTHDLPKVHFGWDGEKNAP